MGMIAIILLMGIVKKNAIMLVDFALEAERQRGLDRRSTAIHEACLERFRPILMTTLAALFGALAAGIGVRHRGGAATPAGHRDRRRPDRVADADALHDAGGVSRVGALGRKAPADHGSGRCFCLAGHCQLRSPLARSRSTLELVPDAQHRCLAPGGSHDLQAQRQSFRCEAATDHQ